jgi:hypothetical protein
VREGVRGEGGKRLYGYWTKRLRKEGREGGGEGGRANGNLHIQRIRRKKENDDLASNRRLDV